MNIIELIDRDFKNEFHFNSFKLLLRYRIIRAPFDGGCEIGFFVVEHIRYWSLGEQ